MIKLRLNIERSNSFLFEVDKQKIDKYYKHALSILDGNLVVQSGLDSISINKNIDWNYEHKASSNTYKLYLHTLNFIKFLTVSYVKTGERDFVEAAHSYLKDWIENNYLTKNNTEKVWYDHTVSSRVQNIIEYQINAPGEYKIDENLFNDMIEYHLDFLISPENYNETNHGIMVDRAIIKIALLIENEGEKDKYVSLAKSRIEKAILRDYSYRNMHLENSPSYHRMVTAWLTDISKFLEKAQSPLKDKYLKRLNDAEKLNGLLINYNGEFPMIGDTSYVKTNIKKIHEDFIDYEAGLAVINHRPTESTLIFNNGFQNNGHKHFDDLSFVLSVRGEQVFVDSGKYNHARRDPIRKHMVSPKAHNTLSLKGKEYELSDKDKIEMSNYLNFGKFKYISGIHEAYDNTKLKRVIVSFGGVNTVIIDKVRSSETNEFVQNFLLNNDIQLKKFDSNSYKLTTPNNHEYMLRAHTEQSQSESYFGNKYNAIISEKFGKVIETNRIEVTQRSKKTLFITSFLEKDSNIDDFQYNDTAVKFKLNGTTFTIPIY